MTTAEALAVVREAMEGEWFSEEVDAALALIEQRVEEAETGRNEWKHNYETRDADCRVIADTANALLVRVAELEAALREAEQLMHDAQSAEAWHVLQRALRGGE